MLAIERSERVSITTGKSVQKNVAEGDPLTVMGIGFASGDGHGWIAAPSAATNLAATLSLHSQPTVKIENNKYYAIQRGANIEDKKDKKYKFY